MPELGRWAILRRINSFVSVCLMFGLIGCASQDCRSKSVATALDSVQPATFRPGTADAVRVEIWTGCLCGSPIHPNTYEELQKQRAKRMLFGQDFVITATDRDQDPIAFLVRHLPEQKKKLAGHIFKGVAYHPTSDGRSYSRYMNRNLWRLQMKDLRGGDLLVCYPEVY